MNTLYDLPEDITLQILLLLPLDSLLACKCVSKQWRNLIHSPIFFNLYRNSKPPFLYFDLKALSCIFMPDDDDNDNDKIITARRIPKLQLTISEFPMYNYIFPDSTNKMVCVKEIGNSIFRVYNFLTGALIRVPFPEDCRGWASHDYYGFGYNASEDDYNIIGLILRKLADEGSSYCDSIRVYSLKNRAWKSFHGFPDSPYRWPFPSYVPYCFNGALHWIVFNEFDYGPGYKVIVALDLHTRRLTEIKLPDAFTSSDEYNYWRRPMLSGLDGQLCCCNCIYNTVTCFEVWVMSTTTPSCWSKLLCIRDTSFVDKSGIGKMDVFGSEISPSVYRFGRKLAVCVAYESEVRVFECEPFPQVTSTARQVVVYKNNWAKKILIRLGWSRMLANKFIGI